MNKCVICNKEIKNDSQFVKGKWYHNDCIENLNNIINELRSDLKTLWIVLWNMDTEMTGYQNEVFDKYYDEFHKN